MRAAAAGTGLALMVLAGFLRRDTAALYADAGRLHAAAFGGAMAVPVWSVIAVLVAGACAAVLATRAGRHAAGAAFGPGRRLQTLLALALVGFSLVPWEYSWVRPSRSHLVLYTVLAGTGAALFVFGAWRLLAGVGRAARTVHERLMAMGRWRFRLLCAGFTFAVAALASVLVFERIPHLPDSIAQLFQARVFAAGRLWLESPRCAGFFDSGQIISDGRWYSVYPFLHSLLLVPGVLAGAAWLVNPLLGAAFTLLVFELGREARDERTGRNAALLACASPWLWAMSGEFMNHASALVLLTALLVLGLRSRRTGSAGPALWAGLLAGLAACVRPYTAAAFVLPTLAWSAWRLRQPGGARRLAVFLSGIALGVSLLAAWNWLTNGDPLLFGYVVKYGPGHEIGFGRSGWGAAHTPLRGLLNTGHDLNLFNRFVLEWPVPTLLLVLLPFLRGTRDGRDRLLLASFLALPVAYFFYWSHGLAFGPRFLYEALGPVLVLIARGLGPVEIPAASGRPARRLDVAERAVPVALAFALVAGLPPLVRWYRGYWGVDGRLVSEAGRRRLTNALVFCGELGDAFNANSLALDGPVVYCRDLGPLNPALTLAYPDRECWLARKGELVRAGRMAFVGSGLAETLDSLGAEAVRSAGYATVLWPLKDVAPPAAVADRAVDYRTLSNAVYAGRDRLEDRLPALALWVDGDRRELAGPFRYIEQSQYFEAGGIDYRQVAVVPGGRVVDVRPAR